MDAVSAWRASPTVQHHPIYLSYETLYARASNSLNEEAKIVTTNLGSNQCHEPQSDEQSYVNKYGPFYIQKQRDEMLLKVKRQQTLVDVFHAFERTHDECKVSDSINNHCSL
eukprot:1033626_1